LSIRPFPHLRPPRYLTQEEVGRFFTAVTDLRDRALFGLMYNHGLRVGEVLLLRHVDLDLDRNRLLVRRLKGGAWSEQIVFSGTATVLRAYVTRFPGLPEEPLFPGRSGPLQRRQIQLRFVRYRRSAGLAEHYTTHSLRHSIATHLLDAGASLEFVQDHLGHQDVRSTSVYARVTNRLRESQMRSLERSPHIVQVPQHGDPPPKREGEDHAALHGE
jgi:site-specific recombinase XerD